MFAGSDGLRVVKKKSDHVKSQGGPGHVRVFAFGSQVDRATGNRNTRSPDLTRVDTRCE